MRCSPVHSLSGRSLQQPLEDLALDLRNSKPGPQPLQDLNRWVDRRLARLIEACLAFDQINDRRKRMS